MSKECENSVTTEVPRKAFIESNPVEKHAYLEIFSFSAEKKVIELKKKEVFIGRSRECQIQLRVTGVSRKHARIFFSNEEYYIEDLGSTNSTYVNDVKIKKCVLRKDDQIYIGGVKISFNE
ncbi:MAG TPA: FHA domain-containing protein [Desulfatiglandales bacterium]|nr:FHA domain-containing protein [Desulfatiglandales bacterium]